MTEPVKQPLVLVADDDEEFREELIPTALGKINARVLKAADVAGACRLAAEHGLGSDDALELVVLDMHMPLHERTVDVAKDGGIQFLKSIIATRCPVIVFTAYPNFRNCALAIRARASAYLPKKSQDAYKEGREGGVDDLIATCKRLLKGTPPEEPAPPPLPDPAWVRENYEWLCEQFGGKWVAFIELEKAQAADIDVDVCDTYGVAARLLEDELRRLVAKKAPYLGYLPEVLWVPDDPAYGAK